MHNHKERKSNRWKEYDYTQAGFYFVTICTQNRECFFGDIRNTKMELSKIGEIARACWEEIPSHFPQVILDEYIIMPNHIHGIIMIENATVRNNNYYSGSDKNVGNKNFCSLHFCSLQTQTQIPWQTKWARSLSSIVRGFKIGVTKWCQENKFIWNNMVWNNTVGNNDYCSLRIWQKSYYDHVIRNENSLNKIREYIINNPLKWEFDRNNSENLLM